MRIISFPQESPIYRNIFYSFEHSAHIIYTRCASCSACSVSRPCSSADHVTDTVADSVYVLLRRDHMYVRIEVAGVHMVCSPAVASVQADTTILELTLSIV